MTHRITFLMIFNTYMFYILTESNLKIKHGVVVQMPPQRITWFHSALPAFLLLLRIICQLFADFVPALFFCIDLVPYCQGGMVVGTVLLYLAMSVDGYIADKHGSVSRFHNSRLYYIRPLNMQLPLELLLQGELWSE